MPRSRRSLALPAAAVLVAATVHAHNGEFILAKAAPIPGGGLLLEITADYGNNPLLSTEEDARTAIRSCLQIESAGGTLPLEALAPFTFEKRSQPDPDSPLPKDPADSNQNHWLLTGRWRATPASAQARLSAPKESPHSVVLWTPPQPEMPTRWAMLLGGDQAPDIPLPPARRSLPFLPFLASCSILLLAAVGKRLRPKPSPIPPH